jgi:hypothetical protein
MFKRLIALLALLCLSFQAVAAKPQPLPMPLAPALPVEIVFDQQELATDVPDNTAVAMQFGLIGVLVGAVATQVQVTNAERRVVELRNHLVPMDVNGRFEAALRAALVSEGISPAPSVTVFHNAADWVEALKTTPAPQDVLVVSPRYSILSNFELMKVQATVSLVHRERRKNGKLKLRTLTTRTYAFHFPLDKKRGSSAEEDAARWAGMGPPSLHGIVQAGIDQVAAMMAYDFSAAGRADHQARVKHEKAVLGERTFPGRELRRGEGWVWTRTVAGKPQFGGIVGHHPLAGTPGELALQVASAPAAPAAPAPVADAAVPAAADAAAPPVSGASAPAAPAAPSHGG